MDNLIQLIGQQVTPDILRKASAMTGESEAATQSALNAMLPTLVGAFAHKGANENGAKKVMDWVGAQGDSDQFINGYSGMLDNAESSDWLQDTGGALVGWLMGSKSGDSANMISSMAGIGGGSSSKLMSMIAPLALAVIGKKALGGGMGAGGLASMFLGQKSFLQASAPAGLMGLLGLNSFDDLGKAATTTYTTTTTTTTSSAGATSASSSVSAPAVSTPAVSAGTAAVGAVAAAGTAAAASVPSFQSGNVAASGISTPSVSTPSVSTPDVNIATPSVSTPAVSAPSVSTPAVSTPDVNIATPSVPTAKVNLPDVDLPTAEIEKPRFTKIEADKRDFAHKSGRATASVDTSASASASAKSGRVDVGEAVVETETAEKSLFTKVLLDKRDIPWGNFGGRWFLWTIVTAAISAGVLFALNALQPFLGMFMGA